MSSPTKLNSIELFAGAGGLGLGLQKSGFHPIQVVEWDRYCCLTLSDNGELFDQARKPFRVIQEDVRNLDFQAFEDKVELVSGGPPCQPFSMGGKHKAHADSRDMFPEAVRAVREIRPKAFVFENVKGLTRQAFRNYFEYIRLQMIYPELVSHDQEEWSDHLTRLEKHHTSGVRTGLQYRVITRVLNSADYGVPQKRERVIFVGFRQDLDIEWSFPNPTHSQASLAWDQIRDGSYWSEHKVPVPDRIVTDRMRSLGMRIEERPTLKRWRTVRDAFAGLPDPETGHCDSPPNHVFQPGARVYPGHTGSPLDEPSKTLKAGVHGVPGGENMVVRADGNVRYFTVRESARLQTFPDQFTFHGSWSETMRQLGNAVPVKLAEVIGDSVRSHLMKTS